MKKILSIAIVALISLSFTTAQWQADFEKAKQTAKEKHELILLNFSGSDWCGPCIRMRREIFDNTSFLSVADNNLVMVNADFPRNKKNQPDKAIKKQNEALADKYNPEGKFPYTLLIDPSGKVVKAWDGLPEEDAIKFSAEVKAICDAHR